MNETQKRIKAYKDALPGLRERVVAVALLLVMSLAMMTSASFAWLTISRNPEVTGVNTTVAANGNLEIALATGDGKTAPGESQVGDSSAAGDQSVTAANLTWGNLINLSDESYGLENLTLRPAQLNTTALLTSPLYGAVYSADGRIEKLTSNFSYTSWVPASGNVPGYFGLSTNVGVRAVSSTKIEAVGFYGNYLALKDEAEPSNAVAGNAFAAITQNDTWMTSLATMIGIHMTATLNYEDEYVNAEVSPEDLQNLIDMYDAFIAAFKLEAEAMANLLNLELYLAYGGDTSKYNTYSGSAVLAATANSGRDLVAATVGEKVVKITDLKTFLDDYNMLVENLRYLKLIQEDGNRKWTASGGTFEVDGSMITVPSLKQIVNKLVDINSCLVDGKTVSALLTEFSSGMSGYTTAMGYMNKEVSCVITNGVLYNFEQRTGTSVKVTKKNSNNKEGLPVSATMYVNTMNIGEVTATIYATITTSATKPSLYAQDLTHADTLYTGADSNVGEVTAEDTYALAIDLWVRTNAESSYLTLEGNILTKSEEVVDTGKDANGNTVELYTLTRTDTVEETVDATDADGETTGETTTNSYTITNTYDLYQVVTTNEDSTQTVTWYNANTYSVFELKDGETPTKKMKTVTTTTGYEGVNRVWDDKDYLSVDATTQGSGSCYVYYADSPEDQARSLALLESLKVAFVDSQGALLATAEMDTGHYYAENGRVIVPLVLSRADSINLGEDSEGNTTYGITKLEKNVATRITAIVYLDGTSLTNDNVLSAADIQGKLNIQFGSSVDLHPIENEDLASKELKVSASVDKTSFDYDTATEPMEVNVTVNVDGDEPSTMTAFFVRAINATQGSREQTFTLTRGDDGQWHGSYTFTSPGEYVLRSVRLDGVDYDLSSTPTVSISGFAVASLSCSEAAGNHISIMTAANSSTVNLNLKFATNDVSKMPSTVQGRFLREDGSAVNINFTLNPTTQIWSGSATFLTSGEYTLEFLVLDGEYVALADGLQQTATVYLGMRVAVYTTSPTSFKFLPDEMEENQKLLGIQVKIMDNAGNEMTGLTGAKLVYGQESGVQSMDTDLTWNPVSGYYEGALKALESGGPGNWVFRNVTVDGNTITNATASPIFKLISPEPPSFAGLPNTTDYQFAPGGEAFLQANLNYSSTAKVLAVITDASGNEYEVSGTAVGTSGNVTTWKFAIPTNSSGAYSGKQDGYWTMKEIRIWEYYEENGDYVSIENDPMVIDVLDKNYTVKVVQTFTLKFNENDGNTDKTLNGTFLQTQTLGSANGIALNFDLYDFEGQALRNVTGIKLTYDYDGNSSEHGHYTSNSVVGQTGVFEVNFAADSTGTHFVQTNAPEVTYAGGYTPAQFSITISGTPYTYTVASSNLGTVPTFTVKSEAPEVTVTGVGTSGETLQTSVGSAYRVYTVKEPSSTSQLIGGNYGTEFSSYTTYGAVVYIQVPLVGSGRYDQEAAEACAPTVTLSLTGVPSGTTATMTFTPTAEYADSSVSVFSFTNGTATANVGRAVNGVRGWFGPDDYPECYPAGKMTQNQIIVTYNSVDYTVSLDEEITINQPQYPPYIDFVINDETFYSEGGTTPVRVYSQNGESITMTLPQPASWGYQDAKAGKTITDSDYTNTGVVDSDDVYTQTGSGLSTKWYGYTRTVTQQQAVSEGQEWTVTKNITHWIVNGVEYTAGVEWTIPVSGGQTAVAKIHSVNSNYIDVITTYTRDYVTFTGGSRIYNIYGYDKVSSTSEYYTEATIETTRK